MIAFHKDEGKLEDITAKLPELCRHTFKLDSNDFWFGYITITDPSAPDLEKGDFEEELEKNYSTLLEIKKLKSSYFFLNLFIGSPRQEFFSLEVDLLKKLLKLECEICIQTENI